MIKWKKQPKNPYAEPNINIALPESVSKDDLKKLIIEAYFEIEQEKEKREKELNEKRNKEWQETIGLKNYTDKKLKIIRTGLNRVYLFFKIIFLPQKHIEGSYFTSSLFKMFLSGCFSLAKWILVFIAIALIVGIFYVPNGNLIAWQTAVPCSLLALLFSRVFRLASIEMDKIEDRNYIFGAFACVVAFITMIVTVIALVKGVNI